MATAQRRLGTDLANQETRPWFLWDEDLCVRELRATLSDQTHPRWGELAAKVIRETRDDQVWLFLTPAKAAARYGEVAPGSGAAGRSGAISSEPGAVMAMHGPASRLRGCERIAASRSAPA